jgi:poly(A) polymerase
LESIRQIIAQAIQGSVFADVTYFAGGSVRDYLLGRATQDFDLTVELPQGGIMLATHLHSLGICSSPVVYSYFGTAKVDVGQYQIELVMTRREVYRKKSRYPAVRFASLLEDVMRRDFTINALLMRVTDGEILDLSGSGKPDLADRLIRTLRNPVQSFTEDPLRMLRAVRFAATLGFDLESQAQAGLHSCAPAIRYLSSQSYLNEINKIKLCDNPLRAMQLLEKYNLLRN